MVILKIKVIPNSRKFEICGVNEWDGSLKVKVKAKAEHGKANEELVSELSKMLKTGIEIVSGKTSRNKAVNAENLSREEILKRLL